MRFELLLFFLAAIVTTLVAPPPDATAQPIGEQPREVEETDEGPSDEEEPAPAESSEEPAADEEESEGVAPGEPDVDEERGSLDEDFDAFEVPTPQIDEPRRQVRLETATQDDLREAGYVFGDDDVAGIDSTAAIIALTGGFFVHGLGHLHLGDRRAASFLMVLEGISIALMAGGGSYYLLSGGADSGSGIARPAFQAGASLFVLSYLMDVLGTLQGPDLRLGSNSRLDRGIGISAEYAFLSAEGQTFRHGIGGSLDLDFGGVYGGGGTIQDLFLETSIYSAHVGIRPWKGSSELTHVLVEAAGEYYQFRGLGQFARAGAEARVGGSLELGGQFPQFSNLALGAEVGFGSFFYFLAPEDSATLELTTRNAYVPFDVFAHFNLTQRLNVRGGYGTRERTYLRPLHPLLGIAHFDLLYRTSALGDLYLRTEIGDGIALTLGGTIWFLR